MNQEEFNTLVRAIVFSASTDCCMDSDAVDGVVDALKTFVSEHDEFADGLDFRSLYIYGEPEFQEDVEINNELLSMFGDKLSNHA
jgi:hypothetical protein